MQEELDALLDAWADAVYWQHEGSNSPEDFKKMRNAEQLRAEFLARLWKVSPEDVEPSGKFNPLAWASD